MNLKSNGISVQMYLICHLNLETIGADDPRCPIGGLDAPVSRTQTAYRKLGCPDNFKVCNMYTWVIWFEFRISIPKHIITFQAAILHFYFLN